jgi:hypothetical protein
MTYCTEYCLEMPDDFPVEVLIQFIAAARRVLLKPNKSPAWQEFAGASNLIGWRFRASSEDWQTYKRSLATIGDAADHEELYRRERALFGMFASGVACIESTAYAIAALASHPAVLSLTFGPNEQRACSPRKLAKWLKPYSPASSLTAVLTELVTSSEWPLWVDLRNRMTHRSNLPRMIFCSVGAPQPITKPLNFAATSSTPRVEAEVSEFDALHVWLARALRQLLVEGRNLADMS